MNEFERLLEAFAERIADRVVDRLGPTQSSDEFLDLAEAERLGVPRRTLRGAIRAGKLTATRIGRSYRVRRSDLDAWLASHRVEPKPPEPKPRSLQPEADPVARALADGRLRVVRGGAK